MILALPCPRLRAVKLQHHSSEVFPMRLDRIYPSSLLTVVLGVIDVELISTEPKRSTFSVELAAGLQEWGQQDKVVDDLVFEIDDAVAASFWFDNGSFGNDEIVYPLTNLDR